MNNSPPGLILIDKKEGISSFRALAPLKRLFGGKIGHCGTLDPFATGLLIACNAHLTKISSYFQSLSKTYEAEMIFGTETDTLDKDGVITARAPTPSAAIVEKEIAAMRGDYMQIPPQYSAKKVNGVRAYTLARVGMRSELKACKVHIYAFELHAYQARSARVRITVSKGTYVRAIARDLAYRCDSVAHLTALRRTRIGDIDVAEACRDDTYDRHCLIPARHISRYNPVCKTFVIPACYRSRILQGIDLHSIAYFRAPHFKISEHECGLLFDASDTLLAIYTYTQQRFRYLCVCAQSSVSKRA